jgi:hypothetical protein
MRSLTSAQAHRWQRVTASGYGQNYVPVNAVDGQLSELGIYAS